MSRRQWRRAGLLLVAAACLVAAGSIASAAPMKTASLSSSLLLGNYGLEWPAVINGTGDQFYTSPYGDYIAFEDTNPDSDIKLYNRKTNSVTNVSVRAGSLQWRPRMWGNRIVWLDNRNGSWDIYWYDVAAKQEHRLTSSSANEAWPEIYGDKVVWQDGRNGNWDIYMYDFKTGVTTRVTTDTSAQENPRIQGNRIIFQDTRNGNYDIYWYDIAAKQEHRLTTSTQHEVDPSVWGTRAVWSMYNGTDWDSMFCFYFDANGSSLGMLASGAGNQDRARLYKDTVVWNSGDGLVNMYRMGTFGGFTISDASGSKYEPQAYGDTYTWQDDRNGTFDVYAMKVPSPRLTVSVAAPAWATAAKATGYLKASDGTALANRSVAIQYMPLSDWYTTNLTKAVAWNTADANPLLPGTQLATTDANGKFTCTLPVSTDRYWVRAFFTGDPDAFRQVSSQVTVRSKVLLTKPSGKSRVSNTKSYTYMGYLTPPHTAGGGYVKIKCYRKSGGKWRLKKTYTATLADYDATRSKYSRKIKLNTEGKWRIKAYYPATNEYAETSSSYKYITSY